MKEVFSEIRRKVPYNSAGKILLADGRSYPEQLGGNCVFQTTKLAGGLREQGYDPGFVFSDAHVATLCESDGKIFFMDPSLMHDEPVCLSDVFRTKSVFVCDSFRLVNGGAWKLGFIKSGESCLNVRLIRENPNGDMKIVQSYDYDLSKVEADLPDVADKGVAFSPGRKVLSMNCERQDGTVTRVAYHLRTKIMGIAKFGDPDAYKHDNRVKTAVQLKELAEELDVSLRDLVDIFKIAGEIYERVNGVSSGEIVAA